MTLHILRLPETPKAFTCLEPIQKGMTRVWLLALGQQPHPCHPLVIARSMRYLINEAGPVVRKHPGPSSFSAQPPESSRNCFSNFGPVGNAIPTGPFLFQLGYEPGRHKGRYDARKDIKQELLHRRNLLPGAGPRIFYHSRHFLSMVDPV